MSLQSAKVIISGGGTGGHIFPAIAIANELKKQIPNCDILFVGALGRMEMEKVPKAGYQIIGLPIAGLQRKISLSNLYFPFRLLVSMFKASKIISDFKPNLAIGTGGYASGPVLKAAASKGIPTIIQEQNSYAGITNKLLAKKAQIICVAYEGMEKFFPKEKIILTGNPVRQDINDIDNKKQEALSFFKLSPNKKTILVIGGSLGAKTINLAILNGLEKIVEAGYQLIWQTGKTFSETAASACKKYIEQGIRSTDFIQKMDLAYAAADIVISRAGASSVSELCNTGKPSILVPSPNVAEDHQTKNALALANKNAAILLKDEDAQSDLCDRAISLLSDINLLKTLSENIKKLAIPNSAEIIVKEAIKLLKIKQ